MVDGDVELVAEIVASTIWSDQGIGVGVSDPTIVWVPDAPALTKLASRSRSTSATLILSNWMTFASMMSWRLLKTCLPNPMLISYIKSIPARTKVQDLISGLRVNGFFKFEYIFPVLNP